MGVDIDSQQSCPVCTYPDITFSVASHTSDATVDACSGEAELVAEFSVPCIVFLVVDHEGSLSVKPDIVYLVGKCLQAV